MPRLICGCQIDDRAWADPAGPADQADQVDQVDQVQVVCLRVCVCLSMCAYVFVCLLRLHKNI